MTEDKDYTSGAIIIAIIACVVPVIVTIALGNERNNDTQAKVIHTYLYSGSSACQYSVNGHLDWDYPCPYKVGDYITIQIDGTGVWHLKKN